jgi:hypothetical protein
MGRTLHFQVLNQDQLTDEHLETMLAVSDQYNTGPFQHAWTCENFYLDPLAAFPDWQQGQDWESYNRRFTALEAQGLSPLAIRRHLLREGIAKRYSDEIRGFCKVGGNEWNALLVYSALLKITAETPAKIALDDEGKFLLAPLILQRGKARLVLKAMKQAWQYWEQQGFLAEDRYGCRTQQKAQQALARKYGTKLQAPERFCRPVKPEDFKEHPEYNAGEIMAGFHGEYWQMNGDKNPFDESMHALAQIHTLLGGEGVTIRGPGKQL